MDSITINAPMHNISLTTPKELPALAVGPSESTPTEQGKHKSLTPKVVTAGVASTPFGVAG